MKINEDFKEELLNVKNKIKPLNMNSVSNILLFKDYLSRIKLWYEELGLVFSFDIIRNKDKNDLVKLLFPEIYEELLEIEFYRNNLLDDFNIGKNKYRSFDYLYIYLSIYWDLLKLQNKQIFEKYKHLPDPYDPVFKMIINGGGVLYREGYFNVSGIDISKKDKTINFTMPSLDDSFLEYIDSHNKLLGSDGIPNQEKVNELWQEYQMTIDN